MTEPSGDDLAVDVSSASREVDKLAGVAVATIADRITLDVDALRLDFKNRDASRE